MFLDKKNDINCKLIVILNNLSFVVSMHYEAQGGHSQVIYESHIRLPRLGSPLAYRHTITPGSASVFPDAGGFSNGLSASNASVTLLAR